MKQRIPTIEEFAVNESSQFLNESEQMVSDSTITSQSELEASILKNWGQAFSDLVNKKIGIQLNISDVKNSRGYIDMTIKPINRHEYGIFQYGMNSVTIDNFSGRKMPMGKEENGVFTFPAYIWTTVHFAYNHGTPNMDQGSNGCSLYFPGSTSDSIYYDIVEKKFYTDKEAQSHFKN